MAKSSSVSSKSQIDPIQLDLKPLLTPQIRGSLADRLAAAAAISSQPLAFERLPSSAPTTRISGVVSRTEAIGPALADAVNDVYDVRGIAALPTISTAKIASPLNKILGTRNDDDITGTDKADAIYGLAGNDKLRGGNGNDVISGGAGDDIISGDHVPSQTTQSNDVLSGNNGADKLFGRLGDDVLNGGRGNDQLFGGSGSDRLSGGDGDDQLFGGIVEGDQSFNPLPEGRNVLNGGRGNDFLQAGTQEDVLTGTHSAAKGAGEVDILIGGDGVDLFVLGSHAAAYYTKGGVNQDFAVVIDFNEHNDRVRLHGKASQYALSYDSEAHATAIGSLGSGSYEFVGVFADQDLSALSLTSPAFQYV